MRRRSLTKDRQWPLPILRADGDIPAFCIFPHGAPEDFIDRGLVALALRLEPRDYIRVDSALGQFVTVRLAHVVANGSLPADAWSLIFSALMTFRIVENSGLPAGESAL